MFVLITRQQLQKGSNLPKLAPTQSLPPLLWTACMPHGPLLPSPAHTFPPELEWKSFFQTFYQLATKAFYILNVVNFELFILAISTFRKIPKYSFHPFQTDIVKKSGLNQ